jgi:hypothetical protein
MDGMKEREASGAFLKKSTKKLLRVFTWDVEKSAGGKLMEVFWCFFSKKNFFLP